ncbi:MAG: histidine--tRNA ligase [Lachnospiraceae bacterium]|nr:histidine--tRNA ligase [Lachnospiraceae bacterium]
MTLSKKPVTGMKDILPEEMEIRDYCISVIKDTYGKFGFTSIETPCIENLANLNCKAGGENEKLIFRILKRGEKLDLANAQTQDDVSDGGLRYDLTVPLVRYYSAHEAELPNPFKALQMGSVWRADRPQKGRYRQFMQCDIDILGEASNLAEIELILATTTTLGKLGFSDFKIRLNDRQILKAMAKRAGFEEEQYDEVFIILDKLDKIGEEGVKEELLKAGYSDESVKTFVSLVTDLQNAKEPVKLMQETLVEKGFLDASVLEGFDEIIEAVTASKGDFFDLEFDPTLVRGMSYYTGTIFEIAMPQYGGACGGGGRYDGMVGKFTGKQVPACGFSIGFERIIMLLLENGFKVPGKGEKTAYLIEKGMPKDRISAIMKEAQDARANGSIVLIAMMNKNKKFQKEQLTAQGYAEFKEFYVEELKK